MNLEEAILCWLPALQEHSSSELELVCNLSRAEWSFWRPHHEEILPRVPLDLQMGIRQDKYAISDYAIQALYC